MPATYITTRGSTGGTNSAGITVSYPASGIVAGDLLLLVVRNSGSGPISRSNTDLPDWLMACEVVVTSHHCYVLYKIATGSENGTTFTLKTQTNDEKDARIVQYRGVDPNYPIGIVLNDGSSIMAGGQMPLSSAKVKLGDSIAVAIGIVPTNTTTFTPPSGYTERYDSGGTYVAFSIADKPVNAADSTAGFFAPSVGSGRWATMTVLINPANASSNSVTAWVEAGTTASFGSTGIVWSGASNAATSNDVRASIATNSHYDTRGIQSSNHGFSVPSGATIIGVETRIEARITTPTSSIIYQVHSTIWLFLASVLSTVYSAGKYGPRFQSTRVASPTAGSPADSFVGWGGPGNTWDLNLTPADVADAGFGMGWVGTVPDFAGTGSGIPTVLEADCLSMRVWYSGGGDNNPFFRRPL